MCQDYLYFDYILLVLLLCAIFINTIETTTHAIPIYPYGNCTASLKTTAPVVVATTGSIDAIIEAVLGARYLNPKVYVTYGNTDDKIANKTQNEKRKAEKLYYN